MTLLIPTGEIHMMMQTIRMITSSITSQKSMTGLARSPTLPRTVPKARQKKIMPRVLVPDR